MNGERFNDNFDWDKFISIVKTDEEWTLRSLSRDVLGRTETHLAVKKHYRKPLTEREWTLIKEALNISEADVLSGGGEKEEPSAPIRSTQKETPAIDSAEDFKTVLAGIIQELSDMKDMLEDLATSPKGEAAPKYSSDKRGLDVVKAAQVLQEMMKERRGRVETNDFRVRLVAAGINTSVYLDAVNGCGCEEKYTIRNGDRIGIIYSPVSEA